MNLLYIFVMSKRKEVYNEMTRKKWLIFRISQLLDLITTKENQPIVNQIKGLLNEL